MWAILAFTSEGYVLHANGEEREREREQACKRKGRKGGPMGLEITIARNSSSAGCHAGGADWERTEVVLMHF